jgi:hypothetical protein
MKGTYSPDEGPKELEKLQEVHGPLINFTIRGSQVAQLLFDKWEYFKLEFVGDRDLCPRNAVCLPNKEPCKGNNGLQRDNSY